MVLRIARSAARRPWPTSARSMQLAALAVQPPPPPSPVPAPPSRGRTRPSLAVRNAPGSMAVALELEKRLKALEEAAAQEEKSLSPLFYSEDDLMFLYEDLLDITSSSPSPSLELEVEAKEQQQALEDAQIIQEAERRLSKNHPDLVPQVSGEEQFYHRVVVQAQAVTRRYEEMRGLALKGTNDEGEAVPGPSHVSVPIHILSLRECEALIRACMRVQDGPGAMLALDMMKRSGMPIPEAVVTSTLEIIAEQGNVTATEAVISNLTTPPTERQRHLHVKAHIKAHKKQEPRPPLPSSALAVLHSYEEKGLPAPMKTYTSCIGFLLASRTSSSQAQGWDLFAHMRYVAHPDPDAWLYSMMIHFCAHSFISSRRAEPEKALDLWTEMTVDKKITPTVQAYNAVIWACARSGLKKYVNEAYRLAKEMLDSNRDARGRSAYKPNQRTFIALLEGAKRIGDLGRARWILAEIVRGGLNKPNKDVNEPEGVHVNEKVMMHVFNTYTSHRVTFNRESTLVLEEAFGKSSTTREKIAAAPPFPEHPGLAPSFSHVPPQSHEEIIQEVSFLFQRILEDIGIRRPATGGPALSYLENVFAAVKINPGLLTAYISVFYRHAPLRVARQVFWSVFDEVKTPITAKAYVEALQRCSLGEVCEKEEALQFMEELWEKWQVLEDDRTQRVDARLIESAYEARIRTYARNNQVYDALAVLHSFVDRYPPASIREPPEDPNQLFLSTRTSLVDKARPLVRMTAPSEVPDNWVPPLLLFKDLELLHNRLAQLEIKQGIRYVNWAAKQYEWMLRVRRDEALRKRTKVPK